MKTSAIFVILATAALAGGCAAPQTTTTTRTTTAETTSSRVKSDPTATRTYTQEELAATGQAQVGDQLEKREAAISRTRR
jgi:uncharacterized lipoprotein YajG